MYWVLLLLHFTFNLSFAAEKELPYQSMLFQEARVPRDSKCHLKKSIAKTHPDLQINAHTNNNTNLVPRSSITREGQVYKQPYSLPLYGCLTCWVRPRVIALLLSPTSLEASRVLPRWLMHWNFCWPCQHSVCSAILTQTNDRHPEDSCIHLHLCAP